MKFNEKLIELRRKAGLSQEELGYKLDVTRQTVSKWELGQTTPEMDKLTELARIFTVNLDDLVNDSEISSDVNPITEGKTIEDQPIVDQPIGEKGTKNNKTLVIVLIGALIAIVIYFIVQAFSAISIFKMFDGEGEAKGIFGRFFDLFDKALTMQEEQFENANDFINDVQDQMNSSDTINNMKDQFAETASNALLQIYNGSQSGLSVKKLLDQVITINKTKEQKITFKYNESETQDTEEIKNVKMRLDDTDNFEVSFDYDENKNINKVTVERIIDRFEVSSFNNGLGIFSGSSVGAQVTQVLDNIITSNKTKERKITVKYNGTETQDETGIRNIKKQIGTFNKYDIIFDYDANGFIVKATIEKM